MNFSSKNTVRINSGVVLALGLALLAPLALSLGYRNGSWPSFTLPAALNVIGPGIGRLGASESYAIVDSFGRVVLTVCMLLGRLRS